MKLCLGLLLLCACQKNAEDKPAPAPAPALAPVASGSYASDIQTLCNSLTLSGADKLEPGDRTYIIANWLAANMKTPESRQFLVKIQPLTGEPKAAALEAEAKRVGLDGCALAAEWRK